MNDLVRFLLALMVAFIGWNAGARLQVFDQATVVVRDEKAIAYTGRVSRELLTGNWIVQTDSNERVVIPEDRFGAMSFERSGMNVIAVCTVLAGLVVSVFVGLPGLAGVIFGARVHRVHR